MKRQFRHRATSISLFVVILAGCSGVFPCDDQRKLPPLTNAIINPAPADRNFLKNNRSHEILIAVVDTGIDYNHPALLDNIHFNLDMNDRPLRLGWDFIGQDGWPCPYIGRRTVSADFELELIDKLIKADGGLGIFLDKRRNVVQEYRTAVWHGTSMAGLIARDSKKIGLLAYRVVPPNPNPKADHDYTLQIIENILKACRKAVEDDADIIVMTAFFHFDKNDDLQVFLEMKTFKEKFEKLMRDHPEVLFIVSAGNGDGYRFSARQVDQIDFPAGMIAENFMVAGSISEEGSISSFSNIPAEDIKAVFFPGQKKVCIYPLNMLSIPDSYLATLPTLLEALQDGNESYASLASYLRKLGQNGHVVNDGTSFSTALAANISARLWIDNDKLTPSDIIKELIKKSNAVPWMVKK